MRSNTRRYISSRQNRSVGRVSRIIISPDVLNFLHEDVQENTENVDTATEPKIEVVIDISTEEDGVISSDNAVIGDSFSVSSENAVVEEPVVIETVEKVDDENNIVENVKDETPAKENKRESLYAKRKKAKENKK